MALHPKNDAGNADSRWRAICITVLVISCFLGKAFYHIYKAGPTPIISHINSDMYSQILPLFTFLKRHVSEGSLPLWIPWLAIGRPHVAGAGLGFLYPANWVILALDAPYAILAIQALAVTVGMTGMMLYLRYLKLDWPPCVLGAVLFGYAVSRPTFALTPGATLCWLPMILWVTHRLYDRPSFRRCAVLAATLSLSFLAGFAQYFYYTAIVLGSYFLVVSISRFSEYGLKGLSLRVGLVALAFVLMLCLVSPQLLPTMELSAHSVRDFSEKLDPRTDSAVGSFSISLLVRCYVNRATSFLHVVKRLSMPIALYYLGSALLLAPFALLSKRHRAIMIALLATLGYTTLFLLSKYQASLAIFGKIPFSDIFRWHGRIIDLQQAVLAALAAIGLSTLWGQADNTVGVQRTRRLLFFSAFVFFCMLGYAYVIYSFGAEPGRVTDYSAIVLACGLIVFILMLFAPRMSMRMKNLATWAIMLLVLFDVASARYLQVPVPATADILSDTPSLHRQIKWVRDSAKYDRVLLASGNELLDRNIGAMFQFCSMNSYTSLTSSRWSDYMRLALGPERFDKVLSKTLNKRFYGIVTYFEREVLKAGPMLGLSSLRYFVTHKHYDTSDYSPEWRPLPVGEHGGSEFYVYENTCALPRAYAVTSYIVTNNEEQSLQMMLAKCSELSHSVILENGSPSFASSSTSSSPGRVHIEKYETDRIILRVETDAPSIVVLTDSYYPGWCAFVDGARRPIWRANSLFRSVEVPAGQHEILFRYRPASLYRGMWIFSACLMTILIGVYVEHRFLTKSRHRASES